MVRNEEFKSILMKLIIYQIIFAIIGFFIVNIFMNRINSKIVERDMALVGNILKSHPELENEIIPYITKEVSQENISIGQDVLKEYAILMRLIETINKY